MKTAFRYPFKRGSKGSRYFKQKNTHTAMFGHTIDLEKEITRETSRSLQNEETALVAQAKLDLEREKITAKVEEAYRKGIADELGFDYDLAEARRVQRERQEFAALPQNRIMSTDAIKAVCVKFGLRFLPTRYYRGSLDEGIGPAVANVKAILGGKLPVVADNELLSGGPWGATTNKPQFSIAAPSSAFILQPRPQDPLLFLRLNAIKWYLVHKWGDDLKTADIRKGEINVGNWNSPFADSAAPGIRFGNSITLGSNMFSTASNVFTTTSNSMWNASAVLGPQVTFSTAT